MFHSSIQKWKGFRILQPLCILIIVAMLREAGTVLLPHRKWVGMGSLHSRFSPLLAAGGVSREGTSAT